MVNYESNIYFQRLKPVGTSVVLIKCIFASIESSLIGGAISMNTYNFTRLDASECIFDQCIAYSKKIGSELNGGAIFAYSKNGISVNNTCFCRCFSNDGDTIYYASQSLCSLYNNFFDIGEVYKNFLYSGSPAELRSCNISNYINDKTPTFRINFKYTYFNNMKLANFKSSEVGNSYFENCSIASFSVENLYDCKFRNTTITKFSGFSKNNIGDSYLITNITLETVKCPHARS